MTPPYSHVANKKKEECKKVRKEMQESHHEIYFAHKKANGRNEYSYLDLALRE